MRSNYQVNAAVHFRVLSENQLEEIHYATLEVLEGTGVNVFDEEALDLFEKGGAFVDGNRVRIPSALVERALRTVPSRVVLYGRDGSPRMLLEDHKFHFGPGPTNNFTFDVFTKERRKPRKEDVARAAILCDALPNIDYAMDLGTPSDVTPELADVHAFEALLLNTTKPIVHWAFDVQGYRLMVEMAAAVAGSLEELEKRPFICLYSEPSSPLQHSREAISKLLFMAKNRLPTVYTPCVMAGATAPATMAGTIVMANSECLAGLVASQLACEGAPFIMGGVVSIMDMSSTILSYGAPELSLAQAGLTELGHYYRIPVFGTAGCTDAKTLEPQAAIEAALSIMLAAESGANLVHDVGYLEFASTGSEPLLVMTDEIIGMVKRITRGIEVNEETLAGDVTHQVGPGGHYLGEDHTFRHFRSETWMPGLIDRSRYEEWVTRGKKTMGERVIEKAQRLLLEHKPEPLPDDVVARVKSIVERAEAEFRIQKAS